MEKTTIERGRVYVEDFNALMRAIDSALLQIHGKGLSFYTTTDRHRPIADVRNMAMSIAWEMSRVPMTEVAKRFNRNHSTLCSAKQNVETLREVYPSYNEDYKKLKSKIYEICEKESLLCGLRGLRSE